MHFDKPQCSAIKIDAHRYLTAAHCFNSLARNTETHFDLENAPKVNLKKINGKTQYTRITKISLHPSVRKVVQQKDDPDFVAQKTSDFADLAIIEIKDKNDVPIADLSFAVPSSEVKMVGFGPRFYGDDTQTQNALSTTIEKKTQHYLYLKGNTLPVLKGLDGKKERNYTNVPCILAGGDSGGAVIMNNDSKSTVVGINSGVIPGSTFINRIARLDGKQEWLCDVVEVDSPSCTTANRSIKTDRSHTKHTTR